MSGNSIVCTKVSNIEGVVRYFYAQENEWWHNEVHKRAGTVDENIKDTVKELEDNVEFYLITSNDEMAAFFGVYEKDGEQALVGFHIGKQFRNKEFLISFWEKVKAKFKEDVLTGICEKNKDALRHLKKQGFKIINTVMSDNKLFYILNLKSCL